jgi:hypothetical protein
MDRFTCGGQVTPPHGLHFPSLTPPTGARGSLSDAPTPDLSAFKGGRTGSGEGVTPGAGGMGTPGTPFTPDTAAKAALHGKLDLTPGAGGAAKPGEFGSVLLL